MINRRSRALAGLSGPVTLAVLVLCMLLPPRAYADRYVIEIYKASQELVVKDGDETVKRFRVAFGKGGEGGKRRSGDNKTPVGRYKIMEFKKDSKFHFFMHLNYPSSTDAWYGYMNNVIDAKEFKEIIIANANGELPPQDTSLGGYIGLHGIGELTEKRLSIHDNHNWTEGCIALRNEEIIELRRYVTRGTPVLIMESRQ